MDQEYRHRLEKIEAALGQWLPASMESPGIKEIFPGVDLTVCCDKNRDVLFEPGKDILSRGGKRWRPLLMTLVCESLGGGDAAIPLAPLVEFSHNASLIHDDIEDDSDQRRGKPAVHIIYGVDTAINSGAFLYFLSLACIESEAVKASGAADNKERLYRLWAEHMRRLHLGQAMDISWHRDIKLVPTLEEYYIMCGLKTGSLARLAAETGAYAAKASPEAARQLGEAAEKLGIGFQILDDVKNLTTGVPGKKRGDDIIEGKKSLPVLLYLHKFPAKREKVFFSFYEAKTEGFAVPEVEELIETMTSCGVIAEAEEKGRSFIEDARKIFSAPEQFAVNADGAASGALLAGLINLIS